MWSAVLLASLQAPALFAAVTKADITPDELLPLGGYTARHGEVMTGVGDPLYARGLLLREGNQKVAIVSCDMLTVPESLYREVRARIPKDYKLFLAATHTHSAPDSQMLNDRMTFQIPGIASYRPRWLTWYADHIANAVPSSPKWETAPWFGGLIRHVDGSRARRKFGDPDQSSTLVLSSTGLMMLTEFAAHATFYTEKENMTRGDWPGLLASKTSTPVLVGAIGDVSPKATGSSPAERCEDLTMRLISGTAAYVDFWKAGDPLAILSQPIDLAPTTPHPTFAKSYGIPESFAKSLVAKYAPIQASVTAVRMGRLAIVGIPGEPTSHLGRQIRDFGRTLGFECVLVISHVNGWMGYILDPKDYDRGGYEATLSFYGREEGGKVVSAAEHALADLAANKVK